MKVSHNKKFPVTDSHYYCRKDTTKQSVHDDLRVPKTHDMFLNGRNKDTRRTTKFTDHPNVYSAGKVMSIRGNTKAV